MSDSKLTSVLRPPGRGQQATRTIAVVDIGTSKICCLIVEIDPSAARKQKFGQPLAGKMLGFGTQKSRGIKAGVVVDLAEAEEAIRAAVGRAERQSGVNVEDVILSVTCGRVKSVNFRANAKVATGFVKDDDIARVLNAGRNFVEKDGRALLHLHGLAYQLDGQAGLANPRGMTGETLSIDLNAVTADEPAMRNLALLIERCYLNASGLFSTPYASGLAVITEEEAELGVFVIDLGGGTTTVSVFAEKQFLYCDAIAVGGNHITYDIARWLSTPLAEAERIKTLYGNLVGAVSDEHELVAYPVVGVGEAELLHVTKADLGRTIRGRVEKTFEIVRQRLEQSGFQDYAGSRVVLTGGGSQLAGMLEFAQRHLDRQVRIGGPRPIAGMPGSLAGPQFATAVGLIHAELAPGATPRSLDNSRPGQGGPGYLGKVGRWFRDSFWDDDEADAGARRA